MQGKFLKTGVFFKGVRMQENLFGTVSSEMTQGNHMLWSQVSLGSESGGQALPRCYSHVAPQANHPPSLGLICSAELWARSCGRWVRAGAPQEHVSRCFHTLKLMKLTVANAFSSLLEHHDFWSSVFKNCVNLCLKISGDIHIPRNFPC